MYFSLKAPLLGLPVLAALQLCTHGQFTWTALPDAPSPRIEAPVISVEVAGVKKLFAIGGQIDNEEFTDTFDVMDVATETWTTSTIPVGVARDHLAAIPIERATGTVVYLLGGKYGDWSSMTNRVDIFDPATGTYSPGPALPMDLAAGTTTVINNTIYYLCGSISKTANSFRSFSLDANDPGATWLEGGSYLDTVGVVHAAGAMLDGIVYGAGGADMHNVFGQTEFASVFQFDTSTQQFAPLPDMPLASSHADFTAACIPASAVPDYAQQVGNVDGFYLVGGPVRITGVLFQGTARIFCFDITNQTWSTLPVHLPTPIIGGAWSVLDGYLYSLAGGILGFEPVTNAWKISLEDLFFRGGEQGLLHTFAPLSLASSGPGVALNYWGPNDVYPLFGAQVGAEGMEFDGDDDRAYLPGFEVTNRGTPTDKFSLGLMFKPDDVDNEGRLIGKSIGIGNGEQILMLSLWPTPAGTVMRARVRTNGSTKTFIANAGYLTVGDWQAVVVTYDGTTFRMVVANAQQQTLALVGEWPLSGTVEVNSDMFTTLGNSPKGNRAFDGKLRNLMLLPGVALPPDLILSYFQLYSSGL